MKWTKAIAAALAALAISISPVTAANGITGNVQPFGNYRAWDMGAVYQSPQVIVQWSPGDTVGTIYCNSSALDPNNQFLWAPIFSGAAPPNTIFPTFASCRYLLIATGVQPVVANLGAVPNPAPPPRR